VFLALDIERLQILLEQADAQTAVPVPA